MPDSGFLGVSVFLRGLDTHGKFSAIFSEGENFCDFLLAFLHTRFCLKRDLF